MGRCVAQNKPQEQRDGKKLSIAIIGCGIGGATAAHYLNKKHSVDAIYDAMPCPGLHAHSMRLSHSGKVLRPPFADDDPDNDEAVIDVPIRAFSPHYYPNLTRMYKSLGIGSQPVDYSSTGCNYNTNEAYFRYFNVLLFGRALPYVGRGTASAPTKTTVHPPSPEGSPTSRSSGGGSGGSSQDNGGSFFSGMWLALKIIFDLLWFVFSGPYLLRKHAKQCGSTTLGTFVLQNNYSYEFIHQFLYPVLSTLLSCTYKQVDGYPLEYILQFFCARATTIFTGWYRLQEGVSTVSKRLLADVKPSVFHFNTRIKSVQSLGEGKGVRVTDEHGKARVFDHVVIATEPNVAAIIWADPSPMESKLLTTLDSHTARIVVHQDTSLMPENRGAWSGMNYYSSTSSAAGSSGSPGTEGLRNRFQHQKKGGASRDDQFAGLPQHSNAATDEAAIFGASMTSVWLNKYNRGLDAKKQVFVESWNPYHLPDPKTVLTESIMSRSVWTIESKRAYDECFGDIQGKRGIWLCGSYATPGVTLLEQAVTSALDIAQDFGCPIEFQPRPIYETSFCITTISYALVFWRRIVVFLLLAAFLVWYKFQTLKRYALMLM